MRSGPPRGDRPLDDLTARARIRDAALELFAERGYRGASIRDVAGAAGVSAGLVQHHFGSKEGLRAACDEHVLEALRLNTARKLERTEYDRDFVASLYEASHQIMRYVARGLIEGWPGAERFFDQAVEDTEKWLGEQWPSRFPAGSATLRRHATVMVAMSLGTMVLHTHVARWLGVDPLDRGHQHMTSGAMVEIFDRMAEFLGTETGRSMRAALADYERDVSSSRKRERDD